MNIAGSLLRFWFEPAPAFRLGLLRAAIGSYALWYVATRRDLIASLASGDSELFEPVGIARLLDAPLPPSVVDWVVLATVAAGIPFVLGLFYRISGPAFALLLMATLCYRNSWSMVFHMHNALVLHVLVLGAARAADGFSIDAIRRRMGLCLRAPPGLQEDAAFGWPVRLICMITALQYFLAGVAKVAGPQGLEWAAGSVLRDQVAVNAIRSEVLSGSTMPLSYTLHEWTWLYGVIGIGTLALELGAPVAVLWRRSAWTWAILTFAMHWGIFAIMGIKFRYHLAGIIFLTFFPVEKPLGWLRCSASTPSEAPVRRAAAHDRAA